MSMLPIEPKDYSDGRTKQAFKDETDINKILHRAQQTGTVSHLAKHQPFYGDFANFDFVENERMLVKAREIFDELPSEIRKEFRNSPGDFFEYANDPAHRDRLDSLLPALAQPGRQHIDVSGRTEPLPPQAALNQATPTEEVATTFNAPTEPTEA